MVSVGNHLSGECVREAKAGCVGEPSVEATGQEGCIPAGQTSLVFSGVRAGGELDRREWSSLLGGLAPKVRGGKVEELQGKHRGLLLNNRMAG